MQLVERKRKYNMSWCLPTWNKVMYNHDFLWLDWFDCRYSDRDSCQHLCRYRTFGYSCTLWSHGRYARFEHTSTWLLAYSCCSCGGKILHVHAGVTKMSSRISSLLEIVIRNEWVFTNSRTIVCVSTELADVPSSACIFILGYILIWFALSSWWFFCDVNFILHVTGRGVILEFKIHPSKYSLTDVYWWYFI